jgi:hypothetical protein
VTAPDAPPPRRLRRTAAVAAGVLVALLLAEAAFRVFGLGAPVPSKRLLRCEDDPNAEYVCYPSNEGGEFRPVPDVAKWRWKVFQFFDEPKDATPDDLRGTPWCVEIRRESMGVRGPRVAPRPAPGVVRIAGIGDSFAVGEGVPYEKSLFVRLQEFLGPGCEALNFGVSGSDSADDLRQMTAAVPTYGCSRAIVVFNLNDVEQTPEIRARMGEATDLMNLHEDRPRQGLSWPRRASRVIDFLASGLEARAVARETVGAYLDSYDPAKNGANLERLSERFRRMASFPDCKAGLVIFPMMYRLDDSPLAPCHDEIARRARDAGLPVLDLLPSFVGQDAATLHVHPIDHHPNGRAVEIAARAMAEWIRREPTLRW